MKTKITVTHKTARGRRRSMLRRRPLQRDILRDVMLSAAECDAWLTLEELGRLTSYPPASISAQLRHLRKRRHGGYHVEKRCRLLPKRTAGVDAIVTRGPLWEYRLGRRRGVTRVVARRVSVAAEAMQAVAST